MFGVESICQLDLDYMVNNWQLVSIFAAVFISFLFARKRRHSIRGKTVLITGGGMGIGKLMAKEFAAEGCSVVIWDIRDDLAASVVTELTDKECRGGARAFSFKCDVSSRDSVAAAAVETLRCVQHIDILVNNAGVVSGKLLLDLTEDQIRRTMGVNTFSNFWTIQEFLPSMLARKSGHIVTISSVMGLAGAAGLTDYCASKFATVGFAKCLRLELQKISNGTVKSTLICPYVINTGMFGGLQLSLKWLYPMLEPSYVARRVVDSVLYREELVIIPRIMEFTLNILAALPQICTDLITNYTGALSGMDHFVGHNSSSKKQ